MTHPCVPSSPTGVLQFIFPLTSRLRALLTLGTFAAGPVFAAAPAETHVFDLPADSAERTLKLLAKRTGVEVVFSTALAAGVHTRAVKGEFSVLDAAQRMLAGTPLHAAQRSATGAVIVTRRANGEKSPDPPPHPPTEPPDQPKTKTSQSKPSDSPPMKSRNLFTLLTGWFAAAVAADAQPTASPPKDEAVQLSPFTVQGTEDVGYLARSSLAGTRLSRPLADIGAQISVFTREMLDDLGVTNLAQAFMYSTNVDSVAEGFVEEGGDNGATRGSIFLNNGNRSRGLGVLTNTREFFNSSFASDTYNSDRFTVASGPNSLLFGLGSPAGVVDTSLKRAQFRDRNVMELRYDNWEGHRSEVDINKVIVDQKLAVRVAGMRDNAKSFLPGTSDRNRRLFGTATYQPWKSTTVRVAGESVWREASLASMILLRDMVTPWWDAGKKGLNNGGVSTRAQLTTQIAQQGLTNLIVPATARMATYVWGGQGTNAGAMQDLNALAFTQEPRLQPGVKIQDQALPNWSLLRPEIVDPKFNAFGQGMAVRHWGSVWNMSVEQKLSSNLFVEVAAMSERFNEKKGSFWRPDVLNIQADPNLYLVDGKPNPDFGRLFVQTDAYGARSFLNQHDVRATIAWSPDLSKHKGWLRHLGHYMIAGLYEVWNAERKDQTSRLATADQQSWMSAAQYNNGLAGDRLMGVRYYLGDSRSRSRPPFASEIIDFKEPVSVTLPDGRTMTYRMWSGAGAWGAPSGSKQKTTSKVLSGQGYYFGDRLVAYAGYREDDVKRAQSLTAASTTRQLWTLQNGTKSNVGLFERMENTHYVDWDFHEVGNSFNWGLVARLRKWFQLHYSQSENFAVQPATSFTPFGVPIPGSKGVGRDYGFSVHLGESKFMLRLNLWDTDVINGSPTNVVVGQVRNIPQLIENRIIEVVPGIKPLGMDLTRYHEFDYQVTNTRASHGMDLELIGNPTPDWRILVSGGRQVAKLKIDTVWFDWVEKRLPTWQSFGRGWDVETISDTSTETVHSRYNQWVTTSRDPLLASDGKIADSQRQWRGNVVVSRQFRSAMLRGLTLGGGARYRSAAYVGYPLKVLPSGQGVLDINRPIKGEAEFYVDAFARYAFKKFPWFSERIKVQAQMNARNLFDQGGYNLVEVKTDGSPKVYRHMTPRQVILALKVSM
ncbi:MAG: TonB-dependent receptor plug domain-containing protein [Opitutaceae bacterium]|nr:TonB-dependent receptor plug domain-containing protein [Opitutaceae bacterium]